MSIQLRRVLAPASFVLLLGAVATSSSLWTQNPDAIPLRFETVSGPVSALFGAGGNIGISDGPDGMLVIDSQFDWLAPKIEKALLERQADGPAFLINTHVHGDHTGGNAVLGKYGTIMAHTNTRTRLIGEGGGELDKMAPSGRARLPMLTFDDQLSLHFNGEEVKLMHPVPSHTDTDVMVWFTGSNVLHMGDLFFVNAFPYVDVGRGGDIDGLIATVQHVLETTPSDIKFIPGHGQVCGKAELGEYLEMLTQARSRVVEALAAGKSLDEMKQMQLLGDYAPTWGAGFINADRFLEALVACLDS